MSHHFAIYSCYFSFIRSKKIFFLIVWCWNRNLEIGTLYCPILWYACKSICYVLFCFYFRNITFISLGFLPFRLVFCGLMYLLRILVYEWTSWNAELYRESIKKSACLGGSLSRKIKLYYSSIQNCRNYQSKVSITGYKQKLNYNWCHELNILNIVLGFIMIKLLN